MKRLWAAFALSATFATAHAAVITFDDLAHDSTYQLYQAVTSEGFVFSNSINTSDALGVWGRNTSYQADPGRAALFTNYFSSTTTMVAANGAAFDFNSIDMADVYNYGNVGTIVFTFLYAGGGGSTSVVTLDSSPGLQTFAFNQSGVQSVSWVTTTGGIANQFDNVRVNAGNQVPEPGTLALAGMALLGLAGLRRRRKS